VTDLESSLSAWSTSELREALDVLVTAGYARQLPTDATRWEARSPRWARTAQLSSEASKRRQEAEAFENTRNLMVAMSSVYDSIFDSDLSSATRTIEGLDNIRFEMERLLGAATKSSDSALPHVPAESILRAAAPDDGALFERGVLGRSLFPIEAMNFPHFVEYLQQLKSPNDTVRVGSPGLFRVLIVDRATAMIMHRETARAVISREPLIVESVSELFETLWREAECPINPRSSAELTPRERTVLLLAMRGFLDKEIAKQLKLGVKTVRRSFDSMEAKLGVSSRVAVGVEAGKRGWV